MINAAVKQNEVLNPETAMKIATYVLSVMEKHYNHQITETVERCINSPLLRYNTHGAWLRRAHYGVFRFHGATKTLDPIGYLSALLTTVTTQEFVMLQHKLTAFDKAMVQTTSRVASLLAFSLIDRTYFYLALQRDGRGAFQRRKEIVLDCGNTLIETIKNRGGLVPLFEQSMQRESNSTFFMSTLKDNLANTTEPFASVLTANAEEYFRERANRL